MLINAYFAYSPSAGAYTTSLAVNELIKTTGSCCNRYPYEFCAFSAVILVCSLALSMISVLSTSSNCRMLEEFLRTSIAFIK